MDHDLLTPGDAPPGAALIDALSAPVALFTHRGGLSHRNTSFSALLPDLVELNEFPPTEGGPVTITVGTHRIQISTWSDHLLVEVLAPMAQEMIERVTDSFKAGIELFDYSLTQAFEDTNACLYQTGKDVSGILAVADKRSGQVFQFEQLQRSQHTNLTDQLCDEMRQSLESLKGLAVRQAEAAQKALTFTSNIIGTSQKMSSVSKAARILSLNAQIEGTRAGEAGQGFIVVAEEMAALVDRLMTLNDSVVDLGKQMEQSLPEIADAAHELVRTSGERIGNLDQSIRDFATHTARSTQQAQELLGSARKDAEETTGLVHNVLINLQSYDRMSQRVQSALEAAYLLAESPLRALEALSGQPGDSQADLSTFQAHLDRIREEECVPTFTTLCTGPSASPDAPGERGADGFATGDVEFF